VGVPALAVRIASALFTLKFVLASELEFFLLLDDVVVSDAVELPFLLGLVDVVELDPDVVEAPEFVLDFLSLRLLGVGDDGTVFLLSLVLWLFIASHF